MEAYLNKISETEESQKKTALLEGCTYCGKCKRACPFLERYGLPSEIIISESDSVFLCTNCKACDLVCPESLSPSDALLNLKYELIKRDRISITTKKAIYSSSSYAMRGHRFPFVYYSRSEKAFWPGCSLQGTRPDIVRKLVRTLKTGLVLDCCFDPLFQNGDLDGVRTASERIKERLKKHGINHLILGCTNCKKIFSLYMPEIKTEHVLETMAEIPFSKNFHLKELYLHHPCPSFRFSIREVAKRFIPSSVNIILESSRPLCCGLGGSASAISEELSDRFTEKIIADSKEKPVITYCMGCKNKFLKKGKEAYHILEFLTDVKPLKSTVSSGKKWVNRFLLSTIYKLKNKKFLFGLSLVLAILLVTYLRKAGYISSESLFDFIRKNKVLAPLLFILIYSIGPSLFIPSLPLTIGAGFLWGPFWGVLFSITGATSGAFVSFLLSRYLMGETIKYKFGYERWNWLNEKVKRHGWKAVAFARLLPILPFPVLNYLFGITPIPALHYLWSTCVFMLPACIAYVYFGSSMEQLIFRGNLKAIILGILFVSLLMLLPLVIKPLFKKLSSENGR
ncbi:MAG: VTT domain-containing protein [Thermodesulfovibrionales bacterium]|nr:VTT domain-containing protein [Thermodesulfovibrionales bacterium]